MGYRLSKIIKREYAILVKRSAYSLNENRPFSKKE